ncbi:MAG: S1 RNA-binding domain-containing protein, partial [Steroidobacter sp.]
YPVVERILADLKKPIKQVMGDGPVLRGIDAAKYTDEKFGLPTVKDILKELEKPGRDPRPEFRTAEFKEGVEEIADLKPGMILEGVITNVTNFGAFVDVGVHQDGLVHISMMSNKFISDPREVVKAGEVVKVKVMEVDPQRKRIALSMRLDETAPRAGESRPADRDAGSNRGGQRASSSKPARIPEQAASVGSGLMAEALAQALKKR